MQTERRISMENEIIKEDSNIDENSTEIELYEYCASTKKRCLNDCIVPFRGTPILSDVN